MPKIGPKLVNRGGAGLLSKVKHKEGDALPEIVEIDYSDPQYKNKIVVGLESLIVPLAKLKPDPNNARTHPDRNIKAIKDSLCLYGQVKPVVVQKKTNIVVAGNGTLQCAKEMGWSQIAATFVDLSHIEAAGYGLADNRSAELAKWDFEVVAKLDKLLLESKFNQMVGWSQDELDVLRAADWTPPALDDGDAFESEGGNRLIFKFTEEQQELVEKCLNKIRKSLKEPEMGNAEALESLCQDWLKLIRTRNGND